ncbi:hypothetical protein K3W96_14775, partial [Listeria monocytogenes]|nr:hypothetical protein [Listeria monocytogenes]
MNTSLSLQRDAAVPADIAPRVRLSTIADDKAMLRTAAELTRDLNAPSPAIYWTDLLVSSVSGYGALAVALSVGSIGWAIVAGVV